MILGFIGISFGLLGGTMIAGVVQAIRRPFAFLALHGEPLTPLMVRVATVVGAVFVGGGFGLLVRGLSSVG